MYENKDLYEVKVVKGVKWGHKVKLGSLWKATHGLVGEV